MGLQAVYERFLKAPTPLALAENATLQYVTTLTSFTQQAKITRHFEDQNKNVVEKKSEKVISAVEGLTSVALIVETTLEFISSGGAYLPGLDSFIVGKVAMLPITHFVYFDQEDKITQIRLSWDQGDLLKQAEVIGTRGRNWPVFGGKEQIKMISASTSTANEVNPAPILSPRGRNRANGTDRSPSPSKKFIRDPHASLDLYHHQEEERKPSVPNPVAPRESHKPPPREMSDLFVAGHEDYEPSGPDGSPRKSAKETIVAPKGAHKKFQPSRLFDDEPAPKEPKIYKTNPARYNHFDIGDHNPDDHFQHRDENVKPKEVPIRPRGSQPAAQWDFADFTTPAKVKPKIRENDVVHFSYEDDQQKPDPSEVQKPGKGRKGVDSHFDMQDSGTPFHRPNVPKPRKDAESHFNITDEPTPGPRRIIARTKDAAKIYRDPIFGEEEEERPLHPISNNTRKDLSSNWDINDDAPGNGKSEKAGQGRKGLESHWDHNDEKAAPKQTARAGGRRGVERSNWDF